jgi:hypothetical protein
MCVDVCRAGRPLTSPPSINIDGREQLSIGTVVRRSLSAGRFDRPEPVEWRRDPPGESMTSAERMCRCGLPLWTPPGLRVWQPVTDLPPRLDERVFSVVIYRMDPLWMRAVLVPSGWLRCGRSIPPWRVPWPHVGLCAAGVSHPVVDTSDPAVRTW